jgi:RimJ/RimL family protein N-acetyltransferase
MNTLSDTEQIASIAYCGLICRLCFRAHECDGCKTANNRCDRNCSDEGCFQKQCCAKKGLAGCWECAELPFCSEGIYSAGDTSKIKAFALSIREDGAETFVKNITACRARGLNVEKGQDFDNRSVANVMTLIRKGNPGTDVYGSCPDYAGSRISLRLIRETDYGDLLSCYSDEKAIPLFNSDNCDDDFRYRTPERMRQAVDFWVDAYRKRYFIRWTVIDNETGKGVGTIEMLRRRAGDDCNNYGILRIDLRSDFERETILQDILAIAKSAFFDAFDVEYIVTKAIPSAHTRINALKVSGFTPLGRPMNIYSDYWCI